MRIQIFSIMNDEGEKLQQNTEQALKAMNLNAKIELISDTFDLIACGILNTPAFAVNGKIKSSGKIVKSDEIINILKEINVD